MSWDSSRSSKRIRQSPLSPLPVNEYVDDLVPLQSTESELREVFGQPMSDYMNTDEAYPTQSYSSGQPISAAGAIGPSNWVDSVTYRALRKKFTKRKRKAPTKKRATRRRSYSYGSGRNLGGMGPIVITGRGGYWADKFGAGASAAWKSLKRATPEGTFSRLGRAAGGAMFGSPGASLGAHLGSGVSSVLGFGDYAVKKNDLMMLNEGVPVPTFQNMNDGVIVCHREYIADISQSQVFVNNQFVIQPGNSSTFPWLHQIASQFEQYEILGLLFQFRSTASDFGTTTNMAMGSVIMATEYDTVDSSYSSKLEMENSQYAMSGKPSQDMLHPVECDPGVVGPMGLKYVRSGPVPVGKDNRLYDHGNFQLATVGMPSTTGTIGELWVTYKIAFYKPQFNLGTDIPTDVFNSTSASFLWGAASPTADANNSIGVSISGSLLTFPASVPVGAKFVGNVVIDGAANALSAVTLTPTNCSIVYNKSSTGTADRYLHVFAVTITGPSATINSGGGSIVAAPTACRVMIMRTDTEVSFA